MMPSPLLCTKCDRVITREAATTDTLHQVPIALTFEADNSATFLMTNMMPQMPELNRGVWCHLEEYCRELVQQGKELYIVAGLRGRKGSIGKKGAIR